MPIDQKKNTNQKKAICVSELKKRFKNQEILNGIQLTIHTGENVAIIGKSGTGKSVLIKCLIRLIEPDEGKITLLDEDIMNLNTEELNKIRTKIGFVFQGAALYDSMSVKENLAFPLKRNHYINVPENSHDEIIHDALKSVGMEGTENKYPIELSGGMKKRVGLARSLIMDPELIFYDEPTTGLDPITSQGINELILEIQSQRKASSIIITHDMKCARTTANLIMVLYNGIIYAKGTYDELEKSTDTVINSFFK
ncbi:MAG: ABC transporter ATP-binding protein [Bacteroidota bacterium]